MNVMVKGWCPGALRPMESGDGLIVRVRPWCGTLTIEQTLGLADSAEQFGNGNIDLTRRANLQLRGVGEDALDRLQAVLADLGLLDADAAAEGVRNIMVGPFASPEARALADGLTQALLAEGSLHGLPAKFGWLVDGGEHLTILEQRSDIALCLRDAGVALRLRERWLGMVDKGNAIAAALDLARGAIPAMTPLATTPADAARPMGATAPFGRVRADQLRALMALARSAGATEVRLSPWRALYFDRLIEGAADLGFIVDAGDPLLRIEACPGRPECRSSSVDTRGDARRLALRPFDGTIHVSGCAKGCARSAPADLVLVGEGGRYGVVHRGTTRDPVEHILAPEEL